MPARVDGLLHGRDSGSGSGGYRRLRDADSPGPRSRPNVAGSATAAPRRETPLLHARLPDELTLQVLDHLDPESLLNVAQSSRALRDFVKHTPELRASLAAVSREAREVGRGPARVVAQDLDKVRRSVPLLDKDLLKPLVKDLAQSLRAPPSPTGQFEQQYALAGLTGVLIGLGRMGDKREKKLAKAIATATSDWQHSIMQRHDRSIFMGRALAHVESADPARYKRLTDRLSHRKVGVRAPVDADRQKLARLPEPVRTKVNRYR